jgi:hypothetical protein
VLRLLETADHGNPQHLSTKQRRYAGPSDPALRLVLSSFGVIDQSSQASVLAIIATSVRFEVLSAGAKCSDLCAALFGLGAAIDFFRIGAVPRRHAGIALCSRVWQWHLRRSGGG